jgi:hypothetical protein
MEHLSLIQLSAFRSNWKRLKLTDDDLRALESAILADPAGAPIMRGTGGLRKIRFAPASSAEERAAAPGRAPLIFRSLGWFICALYSTRTLRRI